MSPARYFALLGLVALLASCRSSPPKRFYVLDPVGPQQKLAGPPRAILQVAAVNIPPSLDRQEMVRESSQGALQISDLNRWGAPLADMAQDVLTQDLMERLPDGHVLPPRAAAPAETYEVTVDLLQFGRGPSGTLMLRGGWSLFHLGSDTPVLNRRIQLTERVVSADYAAQAQGMSRLLGRLADDVLTSIPGASE